MTATLTSLVCFPRRLAFQTHLIFVNKPLPRRLGEGERQEEKVPEKPKEPICSLCALWLLLTLKVKVDISQNLYASGIMSPGQHQSLSYFPLFSHKVIYYTQEPVKEDRCFKELAPSLESHLKFNSSLAV